MIIQHSNTTENTTTCCHLETIEYLLHNASKEEEGPRKIPQREYKKGHQGPPTTSTCWSCRPWWAGGLAGTTWRDTQRFRLGCQLDGPSRNCRTLEKQVHFTLLHIFIYLHIVEISKIYEAKPSKRVNFSKHTRMSDTSSITRTKSVGPYVNPVNVLLIE